jgi:hypothetical protein
MVLWNFEEATSVDFLCEVPYDTLILVLNHQHLNAESEFHVFLVIERWIVADIKERSKLSLSLLQCLRINSLLAKDILKFFDYTLVKKNQEVFKYVQRLLQEKRSTLHVDDNALTNTQGYNYDKKDATCQQINYRYPRKLPVLPCVVGRINPNPAEKFRQKDSIPGLFIYRNNKLTTYISLTKVRVNCDSIAGSTSDLTSRLTASINSQGYQITSNGTIFYVTGGGELAFGKSNWNKNVWVYDTITSKWDVVCEKINVR